MTTETARENGHGAPSLRERALAYRQEQRDAEERKRENERLETLLRNRRLLCDFCIQFSLPFPADGVSVDVDGVTATADQWDRIVLTRPCPDCGNVPLPGGVLRGQYTAYGEGAKRAGGYVWNESEVLAAFGWLLDPDEPTPTCDRCQMRQCRANGDVVDAPAPTREERLLTALRAFIRWECPAPSE